MEKIKPGIVVSDKYGNEKTIYPTGIEWLLAFAMKGCNWAVKELEKMEKEGEMNTTLKEVLAALDEFLIYRTEYKLRELQRLRAKHRQENKDVEQTQRNTKEVVAATR